MTSQRQVVPIVLHSLTERICLHLYPNKQHLQPASVFLICFLHFHWTMFLNQAAATPLTGFQPELLQGIPHHLAGVLQKVFSPVRTQRVPCKSLGSSCSHWCQLGCGLLSLQPLELHAYFRMQCFRMPATEKLNGTGAQCLSSFWPSNILAKPTWTLRRPFLD